MKSGITQIQKEVRQSPVHFATKAATIPPVWWAVIREPTTRAPRPRGAYSVTRVIALGSRPPRPRPARKRPRLKVSRLLAEAQSAEAREKTAVETMIVFLRPTQSLTVPEDRAPISMPNVA